MFYEFDQNNSGGEFEVDENLCQTVIIEADSLEEAEKKAFSMGIYYDGVDEGIDCPCCGDRWYQPDSEMNFPIEVGDKKYETVEEFAQGFLSRYVFPSKSPGIRIFYKDGSVKEIFGSE